jgi:hypothetical protein
MYYYIPTMSVLGSNYLNLKSTILFIQYLKELVLPLSLPVCVTLLISN